VTPGNVEFVQVVVSMTVCTGVVAAILHGDDRFARRRTRCTWLPSTRDAAILGTFLFSWLYGAPAVLIHFVKSRWSLGGVGLGLFWALLLLSADFAAQLGALAAIDLLGL
jgi:hypothetical protein